MSGRPRMGTTKKPRGEGIKSLLASFGGVSAKIISVPLVAFVLGLIIPGLLGYQLLQRGAERETHEKAVAAMALISSVRRAADDDGSLNLSPGKTGFVHRGTLATSQVLRRYDLMESSPGAVSKAAG